MEDYPRTLQWVPLCSSVRVATMRVIQDASAASRRRCSGSPDQGVGQRARAPAPRSQHGSGGQLVEWKYAGGGCSAVLLASQRPQHRGDESARGAEVRAGRRAVRQGRGGRSEGLRRAFQPGAFLQHAEARRGSGHGIQESSGSESRVVRGRAEPGDCADSRPAGRRSSFVFEGSGGAEAQGIPAAGVLG